MNPYLWIAAIVILGLTHTGAYLKGSRHARNAVVAEQKAIFDKKLKEHQDNAIIDMAAALEVGKAQARTRVVTREILQQVDKVVANPVYSDCRIDNDGLRIWNAANAGTQATPPGKPDPAPPRLPAIR